MASRVELAFERVATLPQAKTTPQINPVPPKSNPGHGGRLQTFRTRIERFRKFDVELFSGNFLAQQA